MLGEIKYYDVVLTSTNRRKRVFYHKNDENIFFFLSGQLNRIFIIIIRKLALIILSLNYIEIHF